MTMLRVEVDGVEVWRDEPAEYLGIHGFPIEHRTRPATGWVDLIVDDVIISHAVPEGFE